MVRKDSHLHLIVVAVVVQILSATLLEAGISHKEVSTMLPHRIIQLHRQVGDTYIIEAMYMHRENEKYFK